MQLKRKIAAGLCALGAMGGIAASADAYQYNPWTKADAGSAMYTAVMTNSCGHVSPGWSCFSGIEYNVVYYVHTYNIDEGWKTTVEYCEATASGGRRAWLQDVHVKNGNPTVYYDRPKEGPYACN